MVEDPSNSRDKDKKQRSSYYDASEPSSSRRHRRRHNRRDRDSEKESLPEKSLSPAKPRSTHHHSSDSSYSQSRSELPRSESSDGVYDLSMMERVSDRPKKGKERIENHSPEHLNHWSKETLLYEASSSSEFLSCDEDDSVSDDDVSGKKNVLVYHKSESEVSKNESEFAFHLQSEWLNTRLCVKRSSYTQSHPGTSYSQLPDAHLRRLYPSRTHIYEQPREAMDRLIQRNQSLEKENKLVRRNMKLEKENKRVKRRLMTSWVVAVILVVSLSVLSFRKC